MIVLAAAGPVLAETPAERDAPIDQLTLTDDMIAAVGGRKIEGRRFEALVTTGTGETHRGALRATETLGPSRFEITGSALASEAVGDQNDAAARIAYETERDVVGFVAAYETRHLGLAQQSFTSDARMASYGGTWSAWRAAGRFEVDLRGEHLALRDEGVAIAAPAELEDGGGGSRGGGDAGRTSDGAGSTDVASAQPAAAKAMVDHDVVTYAARAGFTSRRLVAFDLDHELAAGISVTRASGVAMSGEVSLDDPHMSLLARMRRGNSRFLRAYIHDTIRVIESLDISGGFVFEHWRWLSSMPPLEHAHEQTMDEDADDMIDALLGPQLGAILRVTPELALTAAASRRLRAPTWQQLVRPVQNGSVVVAPADELHAATVTGGEVGPTVTGARVEARAVAYYRDVRSPLAAVTVGDARRTTTNLGRAREAGIDAAASVRLARPWLAMIDYTFATTRVLDGGTHAGLAGKQLAHTPKHLASVSLAFDAPRIVTLVGSLRYIGARWEDDRNTTRLAPATTIDAMATRTLTRGLAGYVGVENALDRRYVSNVAGVDTNGAPRMLHVGVRLDSARW